MARMIFWAAWAMGSGVGLVWSANAGYNGTATLVLWSIGLWSSGFNLATAFTDWLEVKYDSGRGVEGDIEA